MLIPPLERIFNLVGADVRGWYDGMSRRIRVDSGDPLLSTPKKAASDDDVEGLDETDEYFQSVQCICGVTNDRGRPPGVFLVLLWLKATS